MMTSVNLQMTQKGVITIPKSLRESYGMQPGDALTLIDLGGVFLISPKRSEIDMLADRIAQVWAEDNETLETIDRKHLLENPQVENLPFPVGTAGDFLAWYRAQLANGGGELVV